MSSAYAIESKAHHFLAALATRDPVLLGFPRFGRSELLDLLGSFDLVAHRVERLLLLAGRLVNARTSTLPFDLEREGELGMTPDLNTHPIVT
jgi:hypothetical protein